MQLIPLISHYGYWILFPLVVIEGPIVATLAGFLVFLGYLRFWPTLGILLVGDIASDAFYYLLGRFGNRHRLVKKYGRQLQPLWDKHPRQLIFFGKLAYGLSVPLIVSAGVAKISPGRFLAYVLPATVLQYGGLLLVSYYLGLSYKLTEKYIFYLGLVVMLVLIILGVRFWRYARKQVRALNQYESEND